MTDEQPFNLMGWLEEGESGGGYICQFSLQGGYKVFAAGHSDDTSFFPVENNDAKAASQRATAFASSVGSTMTRQAVLLTLYADSVINRDRPTWIKGQRTHSIPTFTDAFKDILLPSMREAYANGLKFGQKHWGHISYKPDPFKPEDDEGRANLVPYIVELFADEDAAYEAAKSGSPQYDIPSEPEEWDADETRMGWRTFWLQLIESFKNDPELKPKKIAMPKYGLTKELAEQARKQAKGGSGIPF